MSDISMAINAKLLFLNRMLRDRYIQRSQDSSLSNDTWNDKRAYQMYPSKKQDFPAPATYEGENVRWARSLTLLPVSQNLLTLPILQLVVITPSTSIPHLSNPFPSSQAFVDAMYFIHRSKWRAIGVLCVIQKTFLQNKKSL